MDFTKKPIKGSYANSLHFDEENGVIVARLEWSPPARMDLGLEYRLTRAEAAKLAAAVTKWVKAK